MLVNIIAAALPFMINVFRTVPSAASAITGLSAGAVIAFERPPSSPVDWVVVIAGAVGMIANAIVAQSNARNVPVEDR